MACCMAALVFVYQLIDAWRRFRLWCGWPVRAVGRIHTRVGAWVTALTGSTLRPYLVVLVAFELGLGGTLVYAHRDHLRTAVVAVHEGSLVLVDRMCRTVF
jgi:hypothetical protein